MAIGTANPSNCFHQATYPDYFRVTSNDHKTELKQKFKSIFAHVAEPNRELPQRMMTVQEVWRAQRAEGPANIMAIGTANPSNCFHQATYPDYFFRVTSNDHKPELKQKFKTICDNSGVTKRYLHLTEDILKQNPDICSSTTPSLNSRQDILVSEVPKLGKEAAAKAIEEWGQPKSSITHLIFCTASGADMPGADYQLTKLLGLSTVLRLAKDMAENNRGARVLTVCSEIAVLKFHGPSVSNLGNLVGQALFGDGAAAVIVGSDPIPRIEKPLFELVSANQTIVPDSHGVIQGHVKEIGLTVHLGKDIPKLVSENIEKCLVESFKPLGINDWNSIFWMVHPGGSAILNKVESKLGLEPGKLRASRHVLSEYGNMSSPTVLFIMEEMRRRSAKNRLKTTGEGLEWGVLFGFGPGLTVETLVLHSLVT